LERKFCSEWPERPSNLTIETAPGQRFLSLQPAKTAVNRLTANPILVDQTVVCWFRTG